MTHTLLDSRHVASPAEARLCSVSTPKIARKLGYFDDDVGWACTAEVFLDAGYGIASNRPNSVACGPLQSRLRVRIDCAPPTSLRFVGFSGEVRKLPACSGDAHAPIRPTVIVGVSTAAKAFNQPVVAAMARINARPIIFALSNPTSRSECTAEEAYRWSGGRAIFASGSPFAAVQYGERRIVPGQCNNLYIFPAVGLAVYKTRAKRVTDEMFIEAARALAQLVACNR